MSEHSIIIATANTHESRMLQHKGGLRPFVDHGVHVLLLQEVLHMQGEEVGDKLAADNFQLLNYEPSLGLAIALHEVHAEKIVAFKNNTTILRQASKLGRALEFCGQSHRLRERGMIGSQLTFENGLPFTVVNTHPIVFIRAISRAKQIKAMGDALLTPYYSSERLFVGGDMNHYPNPWGVDITLQQQANLQRVELEKATWGVEGTKHEWLARLGSFVTGKAIESFDAELDALLYKGATLVQSSVVDIESDHRSIIAEFQLH